MAQSKLSTFVIDCQTEDLDGAAAFWSRALHRGLRPAQPGETRYRDLAGGPDEPLLMIQRVEHEGRVHLDIESDDIDAEVARLEALGARTLERVRTWVVMAAPTGQRFCVVRPQRAAMQPPAFAGGAEHALLQRLVGDYVGETQTWLDPAAPPDRSTGQLHVESVGGGRWVRLQEHGQVQGKPHAGEMTLGFHVDARQYELSWVDSFHTGSSIILSTGPSSSDGVIRVTGSYPAGEERWGWRTELEVGDGGTLRMRAINIMPTGEEFPAIETTWTRVATAGG